MKQLLMYADIEETAFLIAQKNSEMTGIMITMMGVIALVILNLDTPKIVVAPLHVNFEEMD